YKLVFACLGRAELCEADQDCCSNRCSYSSVKKYKQCIDALFSAGKPGQPEYCKYVNFFIPKALCRGKTERCETDLDCCSKHCVYNNVKKCYQCSDILFPVTKQIDSKCIENNENCKLDVECCSKQCVYNTLYGKNFCTAPASQNEKSSFVTQCNLKNERCSKDEDCCSSHCMYNFVKNQQICVESMLPNKAINVECSQANERCDTDEDCCSKLCAYDFRNRKRYCANIFYGHSFDTNDIDKSECLSLGEICSSRGECCSKLCSYNIIQGVNTCREYVYFP
ncbi:hypothetical protein B4U79_18648, partial [Dinothrombium tinctorium]